MTTALVMAGGGANGAYEVGAARVLLEDHFIDPEIVIGTSVGALNALMLAHYPPGEQKQASRALRAVWRRLRGNDDVYRHHQFFGPLAAVWNRSVYRTDALRDLVRETMDVRRVQSSGRKLGMIAVSLTSGYARMWTELDDDLEDGVMASSAFPVMFEPVETRGQLWVDGGVRDVTPVSQAVLMGATRIYAVIPEPSTVAPMRGVEWNTWEVAKRALGLLVHEVMENDMALVRARHPDVRITVIRPTKPLGDSFDFSPTKNGWLEAWGARDARRALGG